MKSSWLCVEFRIVIFFSDKILNIKFFESTSRFEVDSSNKRISQLAIKDLINDRDKTNQHVNAGLFGEKINDKVHIRFFTRNGFEINNGVVKKYSLPKKWIIITHYS